MRGNREGREVLRDWGEEGGMGVKGGHVYLAGKLRDLRFRRNVTSKLSPGGRHLL